MRRKITWILVVVLVVSLVGSFSAYAALQNMPTDAEILKNPVRKDATLHKTLALGDQSKLKLTYAQTHFYTATEYQDCYIDENNTEYRFNENGKFVGHSIPIEYLELETDPSVAISSEEACKIADQALEDIVGMKAEEFDSKELFEQQFNYYYFVYDKKYGQGGWITGEGCGITVRQDRTVSFTTFSDLYDFKNFDFEKLNQVSKEEIDAEFVSQAKAVYASGYRDCEMKSYQLVKENGRYFIKATGSVTIYDEQLKTLMEYKYALD